MIGRFLRDSNEFFFNNLERYEIKKEEITFRLSAFYDTFDKLIFKNGFYLEFTNNVFFLKDLERNETLAEFKIERRFKYFIDDFEDSDLKIILVPIIGIRAVFHKFEYKISEQNIFLNSVLTPVNYNIIQFKAFLAENKEASIDFIECETVDLKQLEADLADIQYRSFQESFFQVLENKSENYWGKNFDLKQDFAVSLTKKFYFETVQSFLLSFYNAILFYKKGLVEEIDKEFVHDFRVVVRRLLAFLDENDSFLKLKETQIISEISKIQKMTNIVRDLDVIIEKQTEYSAFFDNQELENDFIIYAKNLRIEEFQCVKTNLISAEFNKFMTAFLEYINSLSNIKSNKFFYDEVYPLVLEKIDYLKNIDDKIISELQGKELHKFRIKIKKIRYSLEFYSQFWNEENYNSNMLVLKSYQDLLGRYTDLIFLEKIIGKYNPDLIILINKIKRQQSEIQINIVKNFDNFKISVQNIITK